MEDFGYIKFENSDYASMDTEDDESYAILIGKLQTDLQGKNREDSTKIINPYYELN